MKKYSTNQGQASAEAQFSSQMESAIRAGWADLCLAVESGVALEDYRDSVAVVLRAFCNDVPEAVLNRGDYFVVIDGHIRIAHELCHNEDGSITASLYRNILDYRAGRAMEPSVIYWR